MGRTLQPHRCRTSVRSLEGDPANIVGGARGLALGPQKPVPRFDFHESDFIAEEAEKRGADVIAMGTRGLTGLRHLLLGSTAERVVKIAPCPVMTIRRQE